MLRALVWLLFLPFRILANLLRLAAAPFHTARVHRRRRRVRWLRRRMLALGVLGAGAALAAGD